MISTGNYIFIWLVTGVLMGLGFMQEGMDGAGSVHKASC